tara:strand:- start:274 stop:477 length:204 start_codon:yes stop_codon:yes gene_type:complete
MINSKIFLICLLVLFIFCAILGVDNAYADDDIEGGDDSSIVGGFFNFLGDVLAFPFRVVGSVFDAIF